MYRSPDNKTKKTADTVLSALIEQFHKPNGGPGQFLLNLLAAQCLLGHADGGAILRVGQEKNVDVLALYPPLEKGASAPQWLARSAGFAHEALSSNGPVVKPLEQPNRLGGQPDKRHIVTMPLGIADIGMAVAAFVIKVNGKTDLEASSQRLQLLVGMLSHVQIGPAKQNWQDSCRRLQQATETLSAVNRQQRFTSAAMALCNEVASQWQCERASVGFLKGRYVQLKAMSHTEHFSRKMEAIQDIESAMEECLDQDIEIISPVTVRWLF